MEPVVNGPDVLLWDRDLPWADLRTAPGRGGADVPAAIDALAASRDPESAAAAYWRLDNTVVVQGAVYEAAVAVVDPVVRVLVAGPAVARRRALELLLQIAGGWTDPAEQRRTGRDLVAEVRAKLRPLVPMFLAFVDDDDQNVREPAFELVTVLAARDPGVRPVLEWVARRGGTEDERNYYERILRHDGWPPPLTP